MMIIMMVDDDYHGNGECVERLELWEKEVRHVFHNVIRS